MSACNYYFSRLMRFFFFEMSYFGLMLIDGQVKWIGFLQRHPSFRTSMTILKVGLN